MGNENKGQSGLKIGAQVILSLFIAVVAVWVTNRFIRINLNGSSFGDEHKMMVEWQSDLEGLENSHTLPAGFGDLNKVVLISTSTKLRNAYRKYPLALNRDKQGKFNLEIFADEIEGGQVVVQYDLIEIKSGNTIWELGRTLRNPDGDQPSTPKTSAN